MATETEGKWRVTSHSAVREKLQALGAEPGGTRQERNLLFQHPSVPLLSRDCTLRLRILGNGKGYLTYKGPRDAAAALKVRTEFETGVDAPAAVQAILEALGFRVALEYARTREIWRLPAVEIALDTFYGDAYAELEGPAADVFLLAAQLGLDWQAIDLQPYSSKKAAMDAGVKG